MSEKIKQKKKYRFNFVDFFIILVIVAVLLVAGYFTVFNKSSVSSDKVDIEYVIELKTIKDIFVDKIQEGNEVIETVRSENIGTVVDIAVETAKTTTQNAATGQLQEVSYPEELKDIRITIRKEVSVDDGIYMMNGVELHVGSHINFRVPNYVGSGYCVQITEVKEAAK